MRYALYWTPRPDHPLWTAGCAWLGRDPDDEGRPAREAPDRRSEPWRYGLHATVVAPFYLAPGLTDADLTGVIKTLATRHAPFDMPPLEVAMLSDFMALRPALPVGEHHPLRHLADDALRALADVRQAPSAQEIERQAVRLEPAQLQRYKDWGSPYVFEHWRFHMTLSDSFKPGEGSEREALLAQARDHFRAALSEPLQADSLSVFVEMEAGVPFTRYGMVPLGPASQG